MKKFLALSLSDVVFIVLMNVKMPNIHEQDNFRAKLSWAWKKFYNLEHWNLANLDTLLSEKPITKVLIRLRRCAGWSVPLLFPKWRQFSFGETHMLHSLLLQFVCLFGCFTSQVNSYGHGGTVSSPNHTFSWAGLNKRLTIIRAHTFACNWQQPFLNKSAEGRRMTVEIISWSISTKVWDQTGIELATPGSAVRHASVARHVTDCATRTGNCYSKTGTSLSYLSLHHTKLDSAPGAAVRILPFWGLLWRKHRVSFLQCWKSIAWNARQVIYTLGKKVKHHHGQLQG